MKTIKKLITGTLAIFGFMAVISMTIGSKNGQTPWEVPARYKSMENPAKADAESVQMGGMIYKKNCSSCHGKIGLGDGVKAKTLDTPSGDFSSEAFQSQTDGELFYKTKSGRDDMPTFENKIPDEDIWHIVNYTRTLKK